MCIRPSWTYAVLPPCSVEYIKSTLTTTNHLQDLPRLPSHFRKSYSKPQAHLRTSNTPRPPYPLPRKKTHHRNRTPHPTIRPPQGSMANAHPSPNLLLPHNPRRHILRLHLHLPKLHHIPKNPPNTSPLQRNRIYNSLTMALRTTTPFTRGIWFYRCASRHSFGVSVDRE